jgi:PqqD family protein of HPr-rel-A system
VAGGRLGAKGARSPVRWRGMAPHRIPDTTLFRELDGETVLVNLASGEYYSLDEVGTAIWAHLRGGAEVAAIVAMLLDRYDVPAERAEQDTARLLEELVAHGLVEPVP